MLRIIKLIHTLIWLVMASASFYIIYAGIMGIFDIYLYISIGLLIVETLVLVINKWTCPLTIIAESHTENRDSNFDIYLPNWLAKYNKIIFGTIFIIGLLLVVFNYFNK